MRLLSTAALAALLSVSFATDADARRRGSTSEDLIFVSTTEAPGPDGSPLSLCILVEKQSAFFVPFWTSAEAWALAENRCETDSYLPVDEERLTAFQAMGVLPADLPTAPALTTAQTITGAWGLGLGAAVAGFAGMGALKKSKRKKVRQAEMGDASPEAIAILDVMCHTAKADGQIDQSEVVAIAAIAEQLTGTSFSLDRIAKMIELSEAELQLSDFKALTKNLSANGRVLAMKGALQVAASDGHLAGQEQAFIGGLAQALKMTGDEVAALLQSVAGRPN